MSDWVDVEQDAGDWVDVGSSVEEYQPSPTETGLAAMAPTGLTSAIYGLKEAIPVGMEKGFGAGLDTYRRERDQARKDLESSQARNPRAAIVGSMAPYVVGGALPGGTALASIPVSAFIGGVNAAIDSKADLTKGEIGKFSKDTAGGTLLGATFGAAGKYAPKSTAAAATGALAGELIAPGKGALPGAAIGLAARGAASPVVRNYLMKKFSNTLLDVPEPVSERYLSNPQRVMESKSVPEVAQDVAQSLGEIKSDVGSLSTSAQSALSGGREKGVMTVRDAVAILGQFENQDAKKMATDLTNGYLKRMGDVSTAPGAENLTEIETHTLKKFLQGLGDWNSPLPSADKAQANYASGQVNSVLRGSNEQYAKTMDDLAMKMRIRNALAQRFGIKRDLVNPNELTATDTTITALNEVMRGKKMDRAKILGELNNQGYGDLKSQIEDSFAKQVLTGGGSPQGSRKAVVGANIGTAIGAGTGGIVGGPMGAAVGGVAGRAAGSFAGAVADKYGPRMARKMFDANTVINKLSSSVGGSKYVAPLRSAMQRGQDSFNTVYYLMSVSDEGFRRATEEGE